MKKVIVCGAGEIGSQICRDLNGEESCELTVIDRNPFRLRLLTDDLGASGIPGEAADPEILGRAGVDSAELIIAATPSDHVNIVICLVAKNLGSDAKTMARLVNRRFLAAVGRSSVKSGPIDEAINPDSQLAQYTVQLLESSSLFDKRVLFAEGEGPGGGEQAILCGMRLDASCSLLRTPLRQLSELFKDLNAVVVAFRRRERLGIALAGDQLFPGDEIYLCTSELDLERTVALFGKKSKHCRRVVLAGAGRVGMEVARQLDGAGSRFRLKVIEIDRRRAEAAADSLSRTVVLKGNAMDNAVLEEAGIGSADAIVAVTQDDRTNLFVASQAKKLHGGLMAVSLVNDKFLMPLTGPLEIDAAIDPRGTIMSQILSRVRGDHIKGVGFIGDRDAEIIEAEIREDAQIAGRKIRNAGLPELVLVGAVKRNGKVLKVEPDTRLESGDRVAFFADKKHVKSLLGLLRQHAPSG